MIATLCRDLSELGGIPHELLIGGKPNDMVEISVFSGTLRVLLDQALDAAGIINAIFD
jgi:hypothetical protein